jgi:integrase
MANSNRTKDSPKARKPLRTSDKLTPRRSDGRWCKHYKDIHGNWKWWYGRGSEQEALDEWNRVKVDLLAGREPDPLPSSPDAVVTMARLVNEFLHHKKQRVESGELVALTWQQYKHVGEMLVKSQDGSTGYFDRDLPAAKVRPEHFQELRARLARKYGPVALGTRIQIVRMIFKYGRKKGLLTKDIDYGDEFNRPSKKALRTARNERGNQCFESQQIKALLAKAEPHMKAMILLAINGGLGNTDLAMLTEEPFDLNNGWLNYPRRKTQVFRRIPLWPETVKAVREAIKARRPAKDPADAELLFIGKLGSSYMSDTGGHRIAHEFEDLCEDAGVTGRAFYDLRRSFATIADNLSRDKDGVKAIMGHVPESEDMLDLYRQGFFDERLRSVVEHVHGWLFARASKGRSRGAKRAVKQESREAAALRVVG